MAFCIAPYIVIALTTIATVTLSCSCSNKKENKAKKQRNHNKSGAKKIKSNNFTRSNREKSNIAIVILERLILILGNYCYNTYNLMTTLASFLMALFLRL